MLIVNKMSIYESVVNIKFFNILYNLFIIENMFRILILIYLIFYK